MVWNWNKIWFGGEYPGLWGLVTIGFVHARTYELLPGIHSFKDVYREVWLNITKRIRIKLKREFIGDSGIVSVVDFNNGDRAKMLSFLRSKCLKHKGL